MRNAMAGRVAAIVILVMIIGSMLVTTVAPYLGTGVSSPLASDPNAPAATPTTFVFPTPLPGGPVVTAAGIYVHPSAAFYVWQPQGWLPSPYTDETIASVSLVNSQLFSVVHAFTRHYDFNQSVASLDALNDPTELASAWSSYDNWLETDRQALEDRLVIDFELELRGDTYLAREVTWPAPVDTTWVMILRVVVPGNNPLLLERLTEAIIPFYDLLPDSLAGPLTWNGYVDQAGGFSLKYPVGWSIVDGGPGRTATLSDEDRITLTLEVWPDTSLADAEAAADWVSTDQPGAQVVAVAPVERVYGAGYSVAYTFADADGAGHSGLAVLLARTADRLLVADLHLDAADVNLLADDTAEEWADARLALQTFAPLPVAAFQVTAVDGVPAADS